MVGSVSTPEGPSKRELVTSKTVAAIAVAILLIAFGLSNRNDVPIDWLVGTTDTPLIIVILVSAALGAILGGAAVRRTSSRKARDRS
jgi:uncharacterized integral membrane protein